MKISKSIKIPGLQASTKRGRRNKLENFSIEVLNVGESIGIKKIPHGYTKIQTEISDIKRSLISLCKQRKITSVFHIGERLMKKNIEIRLWRVK